MEFTVLMRMSETLSLNLNDIFDCCLLIIEIVRAVDATVRMVLISF